VVKDRKTRVWCPKCDWDYVSIGGMMENLELERASDNQILINGKKLRVRWLDSYILIWSGEDHPYDEKREESK